MSRNLYIFAATLGLFAVVSAIFSLASVDFQTVLPVRIMQWRTIAVLLFLGALLAAFLGILSHLFEQVGRRNDETRHKKLK